MSPSPSPAPAVALPPLAYMVTVKWPGVSVSAAVSLPATFPVAHPAPVAVAA